MSIFSLPFLERRYRRVDQRKVTGQEGEELAARYLEEQGYKILERNYRCALGEIDIIACDNEDLVFIEVKTRTSRAFGYPQESITRSKQFRLKKIALKYLAEKRPLYRNYRFDVVSILMRNGKIDSIDVIRNAF
ncbi:MAG TPA: YraN family protein [Clostridia bacterium]|nr:YraN family protein [Clostridia bacterium]